jgi:biopolymer transport protein ExbD
MLAGAHININNLTAEIHSRYPGAKGVYVQADRVSSWDSVAQVLAELAEG